MGNATRHLAGAVKDMRTGELFDAYGLDLLDAVDRSPVVVLVADQERG